MQNSDRSAMISAAATGAAVWIVVAIVGGRREAWDSSLYWLVGYPVLMIAAGRIAWLVPRRPWRWALVLMYSQAAVAFVLNPGGNLLPVGLIAFGVLSSPLLVVAAISAAAARKRTMVSLDG